MESHSHLLVRMRFRLIKPRQLSLMGFSISSGMKRLYTQDVVILDHLTSKSNYKLLFLIGLSNITPIARFYHSPDLLPSLIKTVAICPRNCVIFYINKNPNVFALGFCLLFRVFNSFQQRGDFLHMPIQRRHKHTYHARQLVIA